MKQNFIVEKRKIIVKVEIEGLKGLSGTFDFVLDTGATITVIDRNVIKALGFNLSQTKQVKLATIGNTIYSNILDIPRFSLFGKEEKNFEVNVIDLPTQIGLFADGLIGFDFLSNFSKINIDFISLIIEVEEI